MTSWPSLYAQHGPAAVMRPGTSPELLAAETARQAGELAAMIRPLLPEGHANAIDFGCGYGRFLPMLASVVPGVVVGYDPADVEGELPPRCLRMQRLPDNLQFDLVFTFCVLGDPDLDLAVTADRLAGLLADDGLLVICDHMPPEEPMGRWWRFRSRWLYTSLFARCGIVLDEIGRLRQLDDEITVLAGRRATETAP